MIAVLIGFAWFLVWLLIARDLPSVDALKAYEPPLPSNVRDTNGMPVYSYARERRVHLGFEEYPKMIDAAYLSAEDKQFFRTTASIIPASSRRWSTTSFGQARPRRVDDHPAGRQEPARRQRTQLCP